VTWEQALNSQEKLSPDGEWAMDMKLDIMPLPIPGRYKLI
jgi:hypothetical protein